MSALSGYAVTPQKGFAQVLLLLFLLAGIGVGTYIVQNRTNFLPRADCNPGIDNDCDTGGGSEEGDPQGQEDAEKKEEQQDLERGAREAGKSVDEYKKDDCKANPGKSGCDKILKNDDKSNEGKDKESSDSTNPNDACKNSPDRDKCEKEKKSDAGCGDEKTYCDGGTKIYKHGGYWDGSKCVYDFVDTHESCTGQKDGSLSNQDNGKNSELYAMSIQCEDITYCDDGKAYHKTPTGTDDGKCQYDIKPNNSKDCTGKKDGAVVDTGKSKRLSTDPKNSLTPDDIQVKTDKFRAEGKAELDKARVHYRDTHGFNYDATKDEDTNITACREKMLDPANTAKDKDPEKCAAIIKNLKNISRAQDEFDIMAKISDCSGLSEDACKALKQAAFDNARLRYLTAMCDAVESDVQKTNCVLDVGDSQNLLKVKVCTDGGTTCEEADKRVLIGCSSDTSRQNYDFECEKILNYRATDGSIKELPLYAKKQLQEAYCKSEADKQTQFCKDPEKPIYSLSDLPSGLRGGLNASCTIRGLSCIAAGQTTSGPTSSIDTSKIRSEIISANKGKDKQEIASLVAAEVIQRGGSKEAAVGAATDAVKDLGGSVEEQIAASITAAKQVYGASDMSSVAGSGIHTALDRGLSCDAAKASVNKSIPSVPESSYANDSLYKEKCTSGTSGNKGPLTDAQLRDLAAKAGQAADNTNGSITDKAAAAAKVFKDGGADTDTVVQAAVNTILASIVRSKSKYNEPVDRPIDIEKSKTDSRVALKRVGLTDTQITDSYKRVNSKLLTTQQIRNNGR